MKKTLLLLFVLTLFCGCTKETDASKTTYTFVATEGIIDELLSIGNEYGYLVSYADVTIAEYFGEKTIHFNKIKRVKENQEYTFEANTKTEYITVRIDINYTNKINAGDIEFTKYIANVFYLKNGEDIELLQNKDSAEQIKKYIENEELETIHSTEPNLETIFMELTGKEFNK